MPDRRLFLLVDGIPLALNQLAVNAKRERADIDVRLVGPHWLAANQTTGEETV